MPTAKPNINVTPLIDILLVLLIIFMVVTPLKPARFKAKIPEPQESIDPNMQPNPLTVVVSVGMDLKLRLNNQEVQDATVNTPEPVLAQLAVLFKKRTDEHTYRLGTSQIEKTVYFKAPRALPYGQVVKVLDALKGVGADPLGLQVDDLP